MTGQKVNSANIKVEPVYMQWSRPQLTKVKCVADVGGALGGKQFQIHDGLDAGFYVWFDTGASTDPAIAGKTGIKVAITSGMAASAVASALATELNLSAGFFAQVISGVTDTVYVMNKKYGQATIATAGTSGFTVTTPRLGKLLHLGYIDGDVEPGFTEDLLDVTAHQTGTQILQAIRTGRNLDNIKVSIKESDVEKIKTFIEVSGTTFTPSGTGATQVTGWGTEDAKMFQPVLDDCARLTFHPVRMVESDLSEDMAFMAAYPLLSGIVYSGEKTKMINLEFKILPDGVLTQEARVFIFGDHQQNFLAV